MDIPDELALATRISFLVAPSLLFGRVFLLAWRGRGVFRALYLWPSRARPRFRPATVFFGAYIFTLPIVALPLLLSIVWAPDALVPGRAGEALSVWLSLLLALAVLGWLPALWALSRRGERSETLRRYKNFYLVGVVAALPALYLVLGLSPALRTDVVFATNPSYGTVWGVFVMAGVWLLARRDPDWTLPGWYKEWRLQQRRERGPSTDIRQAESDAGRALLAEMMTARRGGGPGATP